MREMMKLTHKHAAFPLVSPSVAFRKIVLLFSLSKYLQHGFLNPTTLFKGCTVLSKQFLVHDFTRHNLNEKNAAYFVMTDIGQQSF